MSHELNHQGFTIIDTNFARSTFHQPIDAAFIFNINGYQVSVSTGGSVEHGGCAQEIYVKNLETGKDYMVPATVEQVINDIMAGVYA